MQMKKIAPILLVFIFLAACVQAVTLKVDVDVEEYKQLAKASIGSEEFKELVGEAVVLKLKVGDEVYYAKIDGDQITEGDASLGEPDYTILVSPAAFLSVSNASDKGEAAKRLIAHGVLRVTAKDPLKQALIDSILASGVIKPVPFGAGSQVNIGGQTGTAKQFGNFQNVFRAQVGQDNFVLNRFGSPIGALSRNHDLYANPPSRVPVYFNRPPGILAQSPGLIYDNITQNTNLLTPRTVFQLNPGLVGPNQILANNPGLVGPADMGIINPGLRGPAEFAYMMGIGAHSNSAQHMLNNGLVPNRIRNRLGATNRWGQGGRGGRP